MVIVLMIPRLILIAMIWGAVLPALAPAAAAATAEKVMVVESAPEGEDLDSLGDLIAAGGYEAENVTEDLRSGRLRLRPRQALFFGSFCTRDPQIKSFFDERAEDLQDFVRGGGCVVVFVQRAADREVEPWLLPGMSLLRGEEEADRLAYVDRKHPLFSFPHAISHRRLNADWKAGPLSRQAFRVVTRSRILAAQDERGQNPWCVEFGWGRGRAIFYACRPEMDRHRPPETRRLAEALVENAVAYALDVTRSRAAPLPDHAIVTEKKAGVHPRILEDSKRSDHAFDMEVNAAVDRGIAFLKANQKEDGSFGRRGRHEVGPTAMVLLAILGAGVNKYRPYIREGIDFILDHPPSRYVHDTFTYDVGLSLMALDAWAAPMYERFELEGLSPEKREHFKFQRDLNDEERSFAVKCRDWLVNARSDCGYWTYTAEPGPMSGDLSNTQFAILGLKSAARCGLEIPRDTWTDFIDALLLAQESSGPTVTMPDFRSYSSATGRPSFYVIQARARAWGYRPTGEGISGSRCAMGISSILIAHEGLALANKSAASRYSSRVSRAVRDGLAWLWSRWSVTENPNMGSSHLYYYLYALERVGVLTGKRYIGDRDWYREGAVFLLKNQQESGAWAGDVIDTAFALMFLKRSTPPPVITKKGSGLAF